MPAPSRKNRLESLLHQEIATTVNQELRDPRLGFLTITRVEMTDDLHDITAFFTVLGDEKQRRLAAKALDAAVPFVQRSYAKVVRTRLLPRLRFAFDDREQKRTTMEELIRKARSSDPNPDPAPPTA
jgi:ribosome-binding factor A